MRTQRLLICYRTRFLHNIHNHLPVFRDLTALRRHILNSLLEDHDAYWNSLISRMDGARCRTPTQFWHMVHRLRGCQRDRFDYLLVGGVRISDPGEVANTFQQHWQDILTPHPLPQHDPSTRHIYGVRRHVKTNPTNTIPHAITQLTRLDPQHPLTAPIEEEDVSWLLRHTPKRSPGPTGIT